MFLWGIGIVVYSTSVGFLRKIKFTPKIEWCLEKLNSMILNLFIFGPFVLFCFSDGFMEKYNYMNCEELEVVGYKRSKSIYTNSQQICEQLIEEKKQAGRY
ncbi:hypothetical protein VRK_03490 [Vibrio sp. MEBiC08052]|nr:hypothetical protein VRK_03490 [Vibrio sp. MEBiC08052]